MLSKNEYDFNPHRHAKIWLSKTPDIFMNDENQLRLVKMRSDCRGDEISLIYDTQLLTNSAKQNLLKFCKTNNIQAVDVRDLMYKSNLNLEENQLIEIYEDEISHLDAGGNLAAASDILRWLQPVYNLGIYSDFDVNITTKDLPQSISVNSDLLLNIGSRVYTRLLGNEGIDINNDIISVIDPSSEKIKKIQKEIIANCKPRKIEELLSDSKTLDPSVITYVQNKYPALLTPRQFRANLDSIMNPVIRETTRLWEHDPDKLFRTFPENKEERKIFFEKIEHRLYVDSVVGSTGPAAILYSLDLPNTSRGFSHAFIEKKIKPMSFAFSPVVNRAFASTQKCTLHAISKNTSEVATSGDLSWTKEGQADIVTREKQFHDSATKIQARYRGVIARMKDDQNIDDSDHQTKPK